MSSQPLGICAKESYTSIPQRASMSGLCQLLKVLVESILSDEEKLLRSVTPAE